MSDLGQAGAIHRRAGRRIEFLSIGWTALESIVGIIAGTIAGSVALISFGIDSGDRSCFQFSAGVATK
jgi:divalent metal cation (Fe/Co/Zn/Cd) transporter